MALNNKSTLTTQAQAIRGATTEGFNTAERVGKILEELIAAVDASLTTETTQRTTQDNSLQSLITAVSSLATTANSNANNATEAANNATEAANNATEAANNATEVANNATEVANNATEAVTNLGKIVGNVNFSDIDSLRAIEYDTLGAKLYKVMLGSYCVGWLLTDAYSVCGYGQTFFTILSADEQGVIDGTTHQDGSYNIFRRFYAAKDNQTIAATGEAVPKNTWSKWYAVGGDAVLASINNVVTAFNYAIQEAKEEIEAQLPSLNDVLEFGGIFEDIVVQETPSTHKSTDTRCKVIYDKTTEKFILAVAKMTLTDAEWASLWSRTDTTIVQPGTSPSTTPTTQPLSVKPTLGDDQVIDKFGVDIITSFNYYDEWADMNLFSNTSKKPLRGKVYIDTTNEKTYRFNGSTLVCVGSSLEIGEEEGTAFDGHKGAVLESNVEELKKFSLHVNANQVLDTDEPLYDLAIFIDFIPKEYRVPGMVVSFLADESGTWKAYQWMGSTFDSNKTWSNPDAWVPFGGGSAIGNAYNVTAERITKNEPREIEGGTTIYDNFDSAVAYAFNKGVATVGMQLAFALSAGSWKNYQYVGTDTNDGSVFTDPSNWIDLAGLSSGSEPIININDLCMNLEGYALNNDCYTLSLAIAALKKICSDFGIDYIKKGLIITYKIDANVWETKQFVGEVADVDSVELWHDFGGGGGSDIETSDTPAEGGEDAFSTGGAYEKIPADIDSILDEETGDTTYFMVNAKGNQIGRNGIVVPAAGSGGGSISASSLTIALRDNPLYAAFGTDVMTAASIRSITKDGDDITANVIKSVAILDGTTGVTLWSNCVDKPSSASQYDYSFEFDFTPFIASAGSREFTIVATDDEGNTKRKGITVVAVDATVQVKGVQTLHYTSQSVFTMGSNAPKSIPLYKFPNATKRAPIEAKIEMFYNNQWRVLETVTVEDNYTKSISINPSNVFGGNEAMTHGAYPIRIQGTDVNSGVAGNTVYTGVMCVGRDYTAPIVVLRYNDINNGSIKLYDTANIEVAAYTPGATSTAVQVFMNGQQLSTMTCYLSQTHSVSKQIQGFTADGSQSVSFYAQARLGAVIMQTNTITLTVLGSAIDAIIKDGAAFGYDFASRSNEELDHTISDNGVSMSVVGSNWSSNGFVKYLGENCLGIKENVTAEIDYRPFGSNAAKSNGVAVQFAFATNNIKDSDAMLMKCYLPSQGVGFYVKGNVAGIYCATGNHEREERKFRCGEKITMAVVVEPDSIQREANADGMTYSNIKMYLNGEEVACIGYKSDTDAIVQRETIKFDGTNGDFYLYYLLAYTSHYEWEQAFRNYLVKLTDTQVMMDEYDFENVLDESGAPSLASIKAKGFPHYVVVAPQEVFYAFDGDTDTSTKFTCTLYYFNPQKPWLDFKATNVQWRRQGTTSAKRPIKNDRFYLNKPVNKNNPTVVTLLHERSEFTDPAILAEYDKAAQLAAINYVQVSGGIPVQIITVKVDYSDSSNANDCGVCDMMNATFRAAGSRFLTPAQRNYDGTFDYTKNGANVHLSGLKMDHSTKNHPVAVFRATNEGMTDAWFHAKGNWKEDKGEQLALGFQKTPGYNLGCLNYGDFYEFFGTPDETLDQIEARFKSAWTADQASENPTMKSDKPYLLSLYCGRNYRFMRYNNGTWASTRGSMRQNAQGKWVVEGDVLNPVTGFELLTYNAMCWWRGVGSVEDMMRMQSGKSSWVSKLVDGGKISATTFPAWTQYFECMVDDDQLAIDLALGKKCPYDLYALLKFHNDCAWDELVRSNFGSDSAFNTAVTAKQDKWKNELHNYASVRSLYTYTGFTDYLAATDQRAKNMQPMFFLEDGFSVVDGVYSSPFAVKMYLNKVYDCDTCNGKDNDGGCTVDAECDPNKPTVAGGYTNPYAGWNSLMFKNVHTCPVVKDDDGSDISLTDVIKTLRSASTTNEEGVQYVPFSPEGALYHFVTKRLMFWPKLISSFDGERKYVESVGRADAVYFYALQGLGRTALPQFIEQRWNYRDGYYQTGGFVGSAHSISGRIGAANNNAGITIRAAKTGYFGVGYEKEGNVSEVVFLEAGQTHRFTQFDHNPGSLFWLYQADRVSELDISEISLDDNFSFAKMSLVEVLKVGSAIKVDVPVATYTPLTTMNLGNLPFLRELDVRRTTVKTVDASLCPRIRSILATGSQVTSIDIAQTSPIDTLSLPASIASLQFVNLPNLTYPGGLTFANGGRANVSRLFVSGCDKIDGQQLLLDCYNDGASIQYLRLTGLHTNGSVAVLRRLVASGVTGLDHNGAAYDEENQCSGLSGRWVMTEFVEPSEVASLNAYFPELDVYNSQYTGIVFDDTNNDPANITNLSNGTSGDNYRATDHILAIRAGLIPVNGKWDAASQKWVGQRLSDGNYRQLANGDDFDFGDTLGNNFDTMMRCPAFWYKGINDFKNQKKYVFWSSLNDEPLSSADTIRRAFLRNCIHTPNSSVNIENVVVGTSTLESANVIVNTPNYNAYSFNVEGMKQVRWPGLNSSTIGAVFLDDDGVVVGKFNMAISNTMFDFTAGSDYVFCDVPANAKTIVFVSMQASNDLEVIAVDSNEVEAIEPDWVRNDPWLCGVYQGSVDGMRQYRSISNATVRTGTNTHVTSSEWTYDANGRPTNMPVNDLNYSYKDLMNLAARRGEGYQLVDYEMSKLMALLWMSLNGTRDVQIVCGYGKGSGGTTGYMDSLGNADSQRTGSNNGNKILGFESWVGCTWEVMDNIAVNVVSYESCIRNRFVEIASDPVDAKYHIYDPISHTERVVQGQTVSGYCIGRVKNGRFCDVICSKTTTDNSRWTQNYCDGNYYTASKCRVVGRSHNNAVAYGGLVYANASNASSDAYSYHGSRLAFRGPILIEDE